MAGRPPLLSPVVLFPWAWWRWSRAKPRRPRSERIATLALLTASFGHLLLGLWRPAFLGPDHSDLRVAIRWMHVVVSGLTTCLVATGRRDEPIAR